MRDGALKSPAGNFECIFGPAFSSRRPSNRAKRILPMSWSAWLRLVRSGNSYRDIRAHVAGMYDMEHPNGTISALTGKLLPELKAWCARESTRLSGLIPSTIK